MYGFYTQRAVALSGSSFFHARKFLNSSIKQHSPNIFFTVKKFELLRLGTPLCGSLGIHNGVKSFVSIKGNTLLPYSSTENEQLDKKQTLWAFFVVRSVVARTELRVG